MFKLEKSARASAHAQYLAQEAIFPLIGAVMSGEQDGTVFGDNPQSPGSIYVEHAFGFAQVFGKTDLEFDAALKRHWLHDQTFTATKVRLYTPRVPDFLDTPHPDVSRSERQRFFHDDTSASWRQSHAPETSFRITGVTPENLGAIDQAFDIVRRFWRNDTDFLNRSNATVAWSGETPAAICYAAAVIGRLAEIDVITRPEHRRAGFGEAVVRSFIGRCHQRGLSPVWDCFTNNAGSLGLCRSCGFFPGRPAYPFFTITKHPT